MREGGREGGRTHGEEEVERGTLPLEQALDDDKEDVAGQVEPLHDVWKGCNMENKGISSMVGQQIQGMREVLSVRYCSTKRAKKEIQSASGTFQYTN